MAAERPSYTERLRQELLRTDGILRDVLEFTPYTQHAILESVAEGTKYAYGKDRLNVTPYFSSHPELLQGRDTLYVPLVLGGSRRIWDDITLEGLASITPLDVLAELHTSVVPALPISTRTSKELMQHYGLKPGREFLTNQQTNAYFTGRLKTSDMWTDKYNPFDLRDVNPFALRTLALMTALERPGIDKGVESLDTLLDQYPLSNVTKDKVRVSSLLATSGFPYLLSGYGLSHLLAMGITSQEDLPEFFAQVLEQMSLLGAHRLYPESIRRRGAEIRTPLLFPYVPGESSQVLHPVVLIPAISYQTALVRQIPRFLAKGDFYGTNGIDKLYADTVTYCHLSAVTELERLWSVDSGIGAFYTELMSDRRLYTGFTQGVTQRTRKPHEWDDDLLNIMYAHLSAQRYAQTAYAALREEVAYGAATTNSYWNRMRPFADYEPEVPTLGSLRSQIHAAGGRGMTPVGFKIRKSIATHSGKS